jgi:hypothetical protein
MTYCPGSQVEEDPSRLGVGKGAHRLGDPSLPVVVAGGRPVLEAEEKVDELMNDSC